MIYTKEQLRLILAFQKQEITGYHVYRILAKRQNPHNRNILDRIADDEMAHYRIFKKMSGRDVTPNRFEIFKYNLFSWLLGPTFSVKLMEKNEADDQISYARLSIIPEMVGVMQDEESHEKELISLIREEKLNYMGSVVLGLNDALVELTGALAGLTFGLQNPALIAMTGSITGIAAAFEYLSTKSEETGRHAGTAALYTGIAYIFTVGLLIVPFLVIHNVYISLTLTLTLAVLIIAGFNYYYSVVRDEKFSRRFAEMALLSLAVAALSFGVGYMMRKFFGVEV
jgi:VIT1/CCC1 family predicted Fe2+/Mn2+ transporter